MKIDADSSAMKMLSILLHVGTLIPVIIVFWKDWMEMILHPVRNRTLLLLVVASLPTLAIYLLHNASTRLPRRMLALAGFHRTSLAQAALVMLAGVLAACAGYCAAAALINRFAPALAGHRRQRCVPHFCLTSAARGGNI